MPVKDGVNDCGIRPGSGKVMDEGGGRPRCGPLIVSATLPCSAGKVSRSALKAGLCVE